MLMLTAHCVVCRCASWRLWCPSTRPSPPTPRPPLLPPPPPMPPRPSRHPPSLPYTCAEGRTIKTTCVCAHAWQYGMENTSIFDRSTRNLYDIGFPGLVIHFYKPKTDACVCVVLCVVGALACGQEKKTNRGPPRTHTPTHSLTTRQQRSCPQLRSMAPAPARKGKSTQLKESATLCSSENGVTVSVRRQPLRPLPIPYRRRCKPEETKKESATARVGACVSCR